MKPSPRNSLVIALAQTGLLVAGIPGGAASNRVAHEMGYPDRRDYLFFKNHGWLLLPLPLIWIAVAGRLLSAGQTRASREVAVYCTGITVPVVLVSALVTEGIEPWRSIHGTNPAPVELEI